MTILVDQDLVLKKLAFIETCVRALSNVIGKNCG